MGKTENVTVEENNEESTTSNEHSESVSVEMDNAHLNKNIEQKENASEMNDYK